MTRNPPPGDEADRLIRQALFHLNQPDADASQLAVCIGDLRGTSWERRLKGEPRTWERFCRELLGYAAADLQEILAGAAALQQAGLINPTVAQAREALRFEVDSEPEPPPPAEEEEEEEATLDTTLTHRERLRLDWMRLTPEERAEFLAWALAQQGKEPKKPRGKGK